MSTAVDLQHGRLYISECGYRQNLVQPLGADAPNRQTKTPLPGRPSGPPLDVITSRPVHGVDRRQCKRDSYLYSY